jgi:polyisoprenyl-teichoic acid--peptidoglycan teichoic acid transferase
VSPHSAASGDTSPTERAGSAAGTAPRRIHGFGAALGFTLLGALIPGTAFLAAGRRKLGVVTLVIFVLLLGAGAWVALGGRQLAAHWAVNTTSLAWVIGIAAVVAVAWVAVVASGYSMLAPQRTARWQDAVSGIVVLVLAAAVAAPSAGVTYLAGVQRDLISNVFGHHQSATVRDTPDPFAGKKRVNVLLLGGDSGPGRDGVRTDTVVVASIDTHTGATTLFSLPRNLENLPFPAGSPLAAAYPNGFTASREDEGLLNAVYRNGPAAHPDILGPTDNAGADWLKLGVGTALGLHLDYYALVNMEGFSRLVDTLGGVTVNVNYWVPINGIPDSNVLPDDYIAPGKDQHLDGYHALQFARGRYGLSDYDRMARQRCTLSAILEAANPATVLTSYQRIAATTQDNVLTDIPQTALQGFVDLGFKAKHAAVRSVVFDEHVINPAYPDYDKIRSIVTDTLSTRPAADDAPAQPTTAAGPSGTAPAPGASPVADVSDACAYNQAQAQAALAAGKPRTRNG